MAREVHVVEACLRSGESWDSGEKWMPVGAFPLSAIEAKYRAKDEDKRFPEHKHRVVCYVPRDADSTRGGSDGA